MSYTSLRVQHRMVDLKKLPNGRYQVALTLSNMGHPPTSGEGGGSGGFPFQPSTPPSVFQTKDSPTSSFLILDSTPGPGDTFYGFIARRGAGSGFVGTGWSLIGHATGDPSGSGTQPCDLYKRTVVSGDTAAGPVGHGSWWISGGGDSAWIVEVIGAGAETVAVVNSTYPTTSFSGGSVTNGDGALLLCGAALGNVDFDEVKMGTLGAGVTEFSNFDEHNGGNRPWLWGGYMANVAAGTHAVTAALRDYQPSPNLGYSAITIGIDSGASSNPPAQGQWIYGEVVSMSGATGTTEFPYATLSLRIRVDGLLISPGSYTETDPATGAFTLAWTPDASETVVVDYQGR